VLIVLPNPVREDNLHNRMGDEGVPDGATVATPTEHSLNAGGPAGRAWRLFGHARRLWLADLPVSHMDGDGWDE
jgi:hypothetical protein